MDSDVVCIASWNADLVARVARPIARGETLFASDFSIRPGGKGSNAAVACARLGARTAVVARIGDDAFGQMALELWQREGIAAHHVQRAAGERSGVAQILVYDDGDNSIAVAPGAGAGLDATHIEAARETLERARIVMACNEVPLGATLAAFRLARAAGVTTLLNPAPARPLPDELLSLTDVLTPNQGELAALAGDAVPGRAEASAPRHAAAAGASHRAGSGARTRADATARAAQALLARGVGAVLVTLGADGCCLYRVGAAAMPLAGWPMPHIADTIGAGDTFTGALAARLAASDDLEAAMRHANAAAALSVTGHGAIGAMPTLAQVRALLRGA